MILEQHPQLALLSADEKLQLIDELWLVLDAEEGLKPTREFIAELNRRMEEYRRDPSTGRTWEQVKAKLDAGAWRK